MSRQIIVGSTTYAYFTIYLIDGSTPALSEDGNQPQINIVNQNTGWQTTDIGVLQNLGYGKYQALLSVNAMATVDNYILAHYISDATTLSNAEDIRIVGSLAVIPLFTNSYTPTFLSYVDINEAESYFATIMGANIWNTANLKDKSASLVQATRDIDRLNFFGNKYSDTQYLEFPRYYSKTNDVIDQVALIPDDIKRACCEIAIRYLDGINLEQELKVLQMNVQSYSSVANTYNRMFSDEARRAGIISTIAWMYLKPYLADPNMMRLVRV